MPHTIDSVTLAAAEAELTAPVMLVKLEFAEGNVCLHTGAGEITWNGDTYTGAGSIGFINGIAESSEPSRSPVTLGLRGIPAEIVAIALGSYYQGRPATVYDGRLDPATMQLVGNPWAVKRGFMDYMTIEDDQERVVTLVIESEFAQWDRPVTRRYTNADQQARYPGDRFFESVEIATERTVVWGQKFA